MALSALVLIALACAARAASVPEGTDPAAVELVPPRALDLPLIPYPESVTDQKELVEVTIQILVDAAGEVRMTQLVRGAGEPFDSAVLAGAAHFRFEPARLGSQPVEVVIPYTHTFLPPVLQGAPEAESDPARSAALEGVVVERGTRRNVPGAIVTAQVTEGRRATTTGPDGRFRLLLPAGEALVRVAAPGYRKFLAKERLAEGDLVKVKYLVDRESYDPYETVVVGARERTEISRTTLKGREIARVPGTFGDPFRVVTLLPGVTSAMSLLPLPVVRGSSPSNTGFFLDGTRVPLLFHLFGGPAVVHPEFIDQVDFYPGGFPVQYGGYTGGIVDGVTRRARRDERRLDIDLNLAQTGLFWRHAFPEQSVSATLAGRVGYPGLLLSLATDQASLEYWDYQARLDVGPRNESWSVFLFGARDRVQARDALTDPLQTVALFHFHRADVRHQRGGEERGALFRLVAGWDETAVGGETFATRSWMVNPQARGHLRVAEALELRGGLEGSFRRTWTDAQSEGQGFDGPPTEVFGDDDGNFWNGGVWTELVWRPSGEWLVVPGVRGDWLRQGETHAWSLDPRILARWKWREDTWLKAMVGRYHQPPRLFIPLPGIDVAGLRLGLLASTQVSVGAEHEIARGVELDVQAYSNAMDPVLFDLAVNPTLEDVQQQGPQFAPWEIPDPSTLPAEDRDAGDAAIERLFQARQGRSYGIELLLRKRDAGNFFGWISYTLSRSERKDDAGWAAFDFDRTHILNMVAGVHLPRNWEIGGRLLLQTGTPLTTIHGYNEARSAAQFRLDLRIDKRAVWNDWLLDFYVDIINASVAREAGGLVGSDTFRYVVPTVGFRAVL